MSYLRAASSVATAAMLAALSPPHASACMPGVWHPLQDAILLWNAGVEVVVWRTLVEQTPPPGARVEPTAQPRPRDADLPFAWLLAVPSPPTAYQVVDVADFEGTLGWARSYLAPEPPGGGGGEGATGRGGIAVGPTVRVGEYEVTPIRGRGAEAGRALAAWLAEHHFPAANMQAVQRYAAEDATFLAVRATLARGHSRGELRPLAIAFRSARIVLPVRLSAGEAPFALAGMIFSSKIPQADRALGHGLAVKNVQVAGHIGPSEQQGPASIIAHVSIAAVMRRMVGAIARRVPEMRRLERGSLAMASFRASPLTVDLGAPDPSWALGQAVADDAPSAIVGAAAAAAPPSVPPPALGAENPPPAAPPRASGGCDVAGGLWRH